MNISPIQHDVIKNFFDIIDWGYGLKHDTPIFSSESFDILKELCNKKGAPANFVYDCVLYDEHDSGHKEFHNAFEFDCSYKDEDDEDAVNSNDALILKITGELIYYFDSDIKNGILITKLW